MQEVKIGDAVWFGIGIEQAKKGLILDLKAHPKIEEYFQTIATGVLTVESLSHKYWFTPKLEQTGQALEVYKMPGGQDNNINDGFSFNYPGASLNLADELDMHNPNVGTYSNISFLRIVGISGEQGIQLGVSGIYSVNQQRTMAKNLTNAVRRFVRGYINTARIEFRLVGREVGVSYTKDW